MPYANISDLPKNVRDSLPEHAQTIYMKAYNSAAEANPDYDEERLAKIAWSAIKKTYRKNDTGEWVRAEIMGEDVPASNYDSETHIVRAIKVGTVGHSPSGTPFECTTEWLTAHAQDWGGGKLIINHYGHNSEPHADIEKSWFDGEFEMMQLANMNPETERRMLGNDHTGFSFDAIGDPNDPTNAFGTNLSILFYPHYPACPATEGCGLAAESDESQSSIDNKDIQIHGSEAMVEKTYTTAEIESIKAESAKVAATLATLEAEAKTHENEVNAYKAEVSARNDKISELTEKADTLFAAEDVETKVNEAKATMFSAEDVEAATNEAVETAIAAEAEKTKQIAAALAAVNNMYPDGLDPEFKEVIVAMIMDGKSHEALVKLGEGVEYKSLKAQIPTGTGDHEKTEEIVAEGGAGVYNPATGSFMKAGE
jgi:cation transport regulator